MLLLAGYVAYRLRHWSRFWYGVIELFVAIGLMVVTAFHLGPVLLAAKLGGNLVTWLGYTTSVYLMVRALDNCEQGLREHHKEWIETWDRVVLFRVGRSSGD